MKLGVLISENSWYWRDLCRAATDRMELRAVSFVHLTASVGTTTGVGCDRFRDLTDLNTMLVRTMPPGSLEQVVFRMDALHRLASAGVNVVNPPRSLEVAIDKYLALAQLREAGVPVPETRVSQTWEQAIADFRDLGEDVVIKPLFGGEGRGIMRVDDEAMAWRVFKACDQLGQVIYQQRFVPHGGYDLRVLLIGDRMFAMRRRNRLDWRTNISRGASAEPYVLDDPLSELSRRAAAAVGTPVVGIDILPGIDGSVYVLEANAVPGWRALSQTLKHDIAAELLTWLEECDAAHAMSGD